ncbi:HTTM domain-containing protein [Streptomyces sp. WMMC500]|uniref:HTTM domain-containing protein n=1 Tax=Streptomyces sp. WMMC500 TaxID=3015154 RepID=UPI00248BFC43|nr:HTTM domain-containing protein [Streptomyces sp. WMMC500]WBB57865.1 HTTM domain-containing protein [Streptomyces sp. WMMC500]
MTSAPHTPPTPPGPPSPPGPAASAPPPAPDGPPAPPKVPSAAELRRRFEDALTRGLGHVTTRALGPYQTAVVRIGFAFTWLCFLLRELPHRHELYGPDGPWSFDLGKRLIGETDAFTLLMWSRSDFWFEIVYLLAVAASVMLLLGWRTRTASVLFMVGVLSLQNRSIFMGDGGDNVIHLMATYLVVTRCGQVWSLDARRARRQAQRAAADPGAAPPQDRVGAVLWAVLGAALAVITVMGHLTWGWALIFWGLWVAQAVWWAARRARSAEPRTVCDVLANLAHNAGLLVIMAQVCFIYATSGWYKVQGTRWQDGTAVYYPLKLDYFTPWPGLADLMAGNGTVIMLLAYGTVIVQVAFPFTLFNRRLKNVLLTIMLIDHASIAVIMGLPFFSAAMISADLVFLPTVVLVWAGARVTGLKNLLLGRLPGTAPPGGRPAERTEAGPADPAIPAQADSPDAHADARPA